MGDGSAPSVKDIAQQVRVIVAGDPRARARFREVIANEFLSRMRAFQKQHAAWEDAPYDAVRAAQGDQRLTDKGSGPPTRDHIWFGTDAWVAETGGERRTVWAWIRLDDRGPEPTDPTRGPWLAHDYALLAAAHDLWCASTDPLVPTTTASPPIIDNECALGPSESPERALRLATWDRFREKVARSPEPEQALRLEAALASVKGDLARHPAGRLADLLGSLIGYGESLAAATRELEDLHARGELSPALRRGRFGPGPDGPRHDEARAFKGHEGRNAAVKAIRSTRALRELLPVVAAAIPSVATYMDDPSKPAHERWTARAYDDVQELGACSNRGQGGDTFPSELPWPDQGVSAVLAAVLGRLTARVNELRAAERTNAPARAARVSPLVAPVLPDVAPDPDEAAALAALAGRDVWPVDELPDGVGADILRRLDVRRWVQARGVVMDHGNPEAPVPRPSEWHSPTERADNNGGDCGWDALLADRARTKWKHPYEVRVTERGRAGLAAALSDGREPKGSRRRKRKRPLAKQERPLTTGV